MTKLVLLAFGVILVYLGYTGKYKDVAGILGVKR